MLNEIYTDFVKSTDRVFAGGRSSTVGASEIGQCARKIWWIKHGAARDPDYSDTWGARVRGSFFENHFWAPALRRHYGDKIKFAGHDQRTLVSGYLSATPDGLVVDQARDALAQLGVADIGAAQCFAVECKTADPRSDVSRPKPEHVFQVHVQLGLIREKTAYRPDYALITYTDASFWHEVRVHPVRFDDSVFANAKARATAIMTANAFDALKPEGYIAGGRECEYCPFRGPCQGARAAVPTKDADEVDSTFASEIAAMARQAKQHEAERDAAEVMLREAQTTIKDRLRARGVRSIKHEAVAVVWSAVKGRTTYDQTALRDAAAAAGVDVESFSRTSEGSDRLLIRVE